MELKQADILIANLVAKEVNELNDNGEYDKANELNEAYSLVENVCLNRIESE